MNPSGKLPFTFPVRLEDNGAVALGEYPGDKDVTYNEGILVGYRYADTKGVKPLFPFGHGLSYTTFKYGKLTADKKTTNGDISFSVTVQNTGKRDGAEVVQLYLHDEEASVLRPYKELKGFEKVSESRRDQNCNFHITKQDLSFFNPEQHAWVAEKGTFKALVGTSSGDIKGTVDFTLE